MNSACYAILCSGDARVPKFTNLFPVLGGSRGVMREFRVAMLGG